MKQFLKEAGASSKNALGLVMLRHKSYMSTYFGSRGMMYMAVDKKPHTFVTLNATRMLGSNTIKVPISDLQVDEFDVVSFDSSVIPRTKWVKDISNNLAIYLSASKDTFGVYYLSASREDRFVWMPGFSVEEIEEIFSYIPQMDLAATLGDGTFPIVSYTLSTQESVRLSFKASNVRLPSTKGTDIKLIYYTGEHHISIRISKN